MLGLHLSVRSLVQTKGLGIYEKVDIHSDDGLDIEEEEEEDQDEQASQECRTNHTQQMMWIYVAYLAEAYAPQRLPPSIITNVMLQHRRLQLATAAEDAHIKR